MTTIGQSLRHSLARTLRRAALLLERLALGVQPPASSADTPVTEDGAAAAAPAGGPPAHWLQRAHRPPPDHWLAHIRRQAPHLLRGDVLNDEAWLSGATPSTPQPRAPAALLLPAWSAPDAPGAERPSPSAESAPTAPTLTPHLRPPPAAPRPSLRPRVAPQFAGRALRLYRTEIAPFAPPSDPPTRVPSAPTADVPSPKASAQPAPYVTNSRPAPQVARGLAQTAPDEALSAARRAAHAQPRLRGLLTPLAAHGPAAARDGRLPSPLPTDELPGPRPAPAHAQAAPPPAPAARPDLHIDAAPTAQPDVHADAAPTAPPLTRPPSPAPPPLEPQRPPAAAPAPWPSLPPTGASDSDRPVGPSAPGEPLWPTLPAWPEPADAEPTPEHRAWQHRQRLEREQRGRLWNE